MLAFTGKKKAPDRGDEGKQAHINIPFVSLYYMKDVSKIPTNFSCLAFFSGRFAFVKGASI